MIERVVQEVVKAGKIARKRFMEGVEEKEKAGHEVVTSADVEIEEVLKKRLEKTERAGFLGEEEGGSTSGKRWIVDPIDGTSNFSMGVPFFAISVAFHNGRSLELGVVHNPITGDVWSAEKGKGAWKNGKRIRVSRKRSIGASRVCFCYPKTESGKKTAGMMFKRAVSLAADVRRLGSASLEMCLLAEGHIDAFFVPEMRLWDVAAGAVIVREAGGKVVDFHGRPFTSSSRDLFAYNGRKEMLKLIGKTS